MQLISVVVVTYNSGKTVLDTLESIKRQTYQMLELVVADDCSKDNTVEIVKLWCKENRERFQNITIIDSKKNTGVTANCNRGVGKAQGKYIQIIAGDDMLPEIAVEEKYRFAEEKQLPIVVTKVKAFGKNAVRTYIMQQYYEEVYRILKLDRREQLRRNLSRNCLHGTMVTFYRKELWKKLGGYDERFPMNEDWPFIIDLLQTDVPLVLLEKELFYYRVSSTSLSNASNNSLLRKSTESIILRKNIWLLIKNGWIKDIPPLLMDFYLK